MNAERDGTDYKKELIKISSGQKINIHLAGGGGWAARVRKCNDDIRIDLVNLGYSIYPNLSL